MLYCGLGAAADHHQYYLMIKDGVNMFPGGRYK